MKYVFKNHIFSSRLEKRLRECGYTTPKGTIDKLSFYNALFPETPLIKGRDDSQYITDHTRPIDKWLKGICIPAKFETIIDICNILNCSPEYFFAEDLEAPTRSLQNASDTIGINYRTLEKIQAYDSDTRALLEDIISGDDFDFLEALLYQIQHYASSDGNTQLELKDTLFDSSRQITDSTIIRAVLGKSAHDTLDNILMVATLLFTDQKKKTGDLKREIKDFKIKKIQTQIDALNEKSSNV